MTSKLIEVAKSVPHEEEEEEKSRAGSDEEEDGASSASSFDSDSDGDDGTSFVSDVSFTEDQFNQLVQSIEDEGQEFLIREKYMDEEQVAEIGRMFDMFDSDGSGFLDVDEVKEIMMNLGFNLTEEGARVCVE